VAAGWTWGALLIAFFVSSTLLGRIGAVRRTRLIGSIVAKGGPRDSRQVVANGGLFALAALGYGVHPSVWWMCIGCGALATVCGDTWGTEIGVLSPTKPRSVIGWQPVPAGTSGGVTFWGTIASIAGAGFIAGVAAFGGWPRGPIVASAAGGIVGFLGDSLLGASIQGRRWCTQCRAATEQPVHACGAPTSPAGGVAWIDNDAVNLLSGLLGAAAATIIYALLGEYEP
jgi:uncharacterized protein (TIGR00297 family)